MSENKLPKDTMVTLVAKDGKEEVKREFTVARAEKLLKYQDGNKKIPSAWSLLPNSGFEYSNGTISKSDTGKTKSAPAGNSNTGSN